ncbi:MAG: glycerophosphodiester phosphodiesterase [Flavobacteriales bacterium]
MTKKTSILLLVAFGLGLGAWKYIHRPEPLETRPVILGHGGMGIRSTLPLNSFESIQKALSYPIRGTEIDVRMTADGVLMAFHGQDLASSSNCSGLVSETNFTEVEKCQNSTWLKSAKIQTLEAVLSHDWPVNTTFSLDVKETQEPDSNRSNMLIQRLSDLTLEHPQFNFLIESMEMPFLIKLKATGAKAEFFYYAHHLETEAAKVSDAGLDGVSINIELTSAEELESVRELNLKVMLWGAGSVFANREALKMKADIIQTDDIGSMVKLLN